ncbi:MULTISPECIES: hypothetical protein [Aeromonas]|uniref:hypothetical protein n=1 Tax=Aeromonas TaxID=642 RepID=UPI00106FA1CD|nr:MULTISPECIES: hypothetical protein [Aeromonas]QXB53302.1 hypothetical protein I6L45_11815 [Aeromonas sp. FDAARGOS 1415]
MLGTILLYEKNSGLMQVKLLCFSAWQWWFLVQPPHSMDENAVFIAIRQSSGSAATMSPVVLTPRLYVVFFQENEKCLSFWVLPLKFLSFLSKLFSKNYSQRFPPKIDFKKVMRI